VRRIGWRQKNKPCSLEKGGAYVVYVVLPAPSSVGVVSWVTPSSKITVPVGATPDEFLMMHVYFSDALQTPWPMPYV